MVTPTELVAARERLAVAQQVLIITHVGPDGDALGSLLGLGWALRAVGKTVCCACADPVPELLRFLPGWEAITAQPRGTFDTIIVVDVADASRMGDMHGGQRPALQIDHHVTNTGFAEINLLDATSASTAELIAEHLEALGLSLTLPVAECLLTGLLTDTLGFRTSSTTTKTLALAQALIHAGANLTEIYDQALFKRSFAAVRLWAEGLARIKLEEGVIWAVLPLSAKAASGYLGKGNADLIDVLASVREADIAVTFVEQPNHMVKVSWRSGPRLNVAQLAASFGGGGHAPAAGADIPGELDDVVNRVVTATQAMLKTQHIATT